MYLVTEKTASKIKATHYRTSELRAYLLNDVINATTDEDTGAVIEKITVPDLKSKEPTSFDIEYSWPNKKLLSGIYCDIEVTPGVFLHCDLDVRIDVDGDDISYRIDLGDTEYYSEHDDHEFDIQLNRKTVELLEELISEDAAEKEYFNQHEV